MERGQWPGLVAAVAVVLIVAVALIAKWYLHRGAEPAGALVQAQTSTRSRSQSRMPARGALSGSAPPMMERRPPGR